MTDYINWGEIEEDWAGFSSELEFKSSLFFNKGITIFLGDEYDEDGEEVENPPTIGQLNIYYSAYLKFIEHLDIIVKDIKVKTFKRFSKIYENKEGVPRISNEEEHFQYLEDINYIRISENTIIRIPIHYSNIDKEHGLEINIDVSTLEIKLGGIAET
ncbi:hypothetical protein [Tenacibaculum maritimum]